ncbi:hypothetical protein [Sutcliffiella deserti]|uniref:hypothetical protein n=1 Tax=Sutcliffiella deserti TaxID=2875501 RepID=UPI001CC066BA|nr:hypothetical protein [Sutcliffiella deserti]
MHFLCDELLSGAHYGFSFKRLPEYIGYRSNSLFLFVSGARFPRGGAGASSAAPVGSPVYKRPDAGVDHLPLQYTGGNTLDIKSFSTLIMVVSFYIEF